MSFNKAALTKLAQLQNFDKVSRFTYFEHTEKTLTIFDAYPKARFHFLVLPRPQSGVRTIKNLHSLRTFLNSPDVGRKEALDLLIDLKKDATYIKELIDEEMIKFQGFRTNVFIGFHAVPSMDHMHLHIISEDFDSKWVKTKKHYNSFNPKLGFFIHLDEVISWFSEDSEDSHMKSMIKLDKAIYEEKLKAPLKCFHCPKVLKNMPLLKEHLKEHLVELEKRGMEEFQPSRKRKRKEEGDNSNSSNDDQCVKEQQIGSVSNTGVESDENVIKKRDDTQDKDDTHSSSESEESNQRKKQRN